MKAEVTRAARLSFPPITVTLTLESQEELRALYRIANLPLDVLTDAVNDARSYRAPGDVTVSEIRDVIQPLYEELAPVFRP